MISVLIYSIITDREYEFRLDANTPIYELLDEIGEMICQKEQCDLRGDAHELILYSETAKMVLDSARNLSYYHLQTGEYLKIC